jgi:histidyl-tRNA synthetase
MSKKFSKEPLRGMKDYYPSDLREYNWIIDTLRDVADRYGYEEYETPQIEPIEIFAAKSSQELVNEQSFIVEKKKGEKLILIPELTPSLARMVAKKSQELKKPIRWFCVPTCFRYERPQRGRLREFKQPNFDILGEESLYGELEIFNIIVDIFNEFGASPEQFQIYYNSRRLIDSILNNILKLSEEKIPLVYKVLDKSDKMEEEEYEKFIINTFQNKVVIQDILKLRDANSVDELLKRFDTIPEEFYESKGYLEFIKFQKLIMESGISDYCTFSSSTVRGLDYYTGVIYEVFDTGTENKRSIFGGGRYDDLISLFSDEKITGTGFGMGVYTLYLFLETYNLIPEDIKEKDYSDTIYIASINEEVSIYAIELARIIREEDFPCIIDYRFKNLKNQLKKASELGVMIALIIGPDEMEKNRVTVKNMLSEEQNTVLIDDLIDEIYRIIDEFEESEPDR